MNVMNLLAYLNQLLQSLGTCREKKKREERSASQKANEAITKCMGESIYADAGL